MDFAKCARRNMFEGCDSKKCLSIFIFKPTVILFYFIYLNKLDALISQIYSWNETLHVSDIYSVHHQEFFTVHTAVVYVIQFC